MGLRGSGLSYANGGAWVAPYALDGFSQKPYTVFSWVKDTTGAGNIGGTFGGFGNTAGSAVSVLNGYQGNFYAIDVNDANVPANANIALSSATGWLPLAAVFKGSASRSAYSKDGQTASDATALSSPQSFNAIGLGDYVTTSSNSSPVPSASLIAEFAIWKAELGPQEIALLQSGVSPFRVRPETLLCYFPLRSDLQDRGPLGLKLSGPAPTFSEHPPVAPTDTGITRSMPMFKATVQALSATLASSTSAAALSAGGSAYVAPSLTKTTSAASTYSTTRSTEAGWFDAAGAFHIAGPFEPRPAFTGGVQTGYLSEPAATNLVADYLNPTPSNISGFTETLKRGVENGIPYVEYSLSGTNNTGSTVYAGVGFMAQYSSTTPYLGNGTQLTARHYVRVISRTGTPDGDGLVFNEYDSNWNYKATPCYSSMDPAAASGPLGTYSLVGNGTLPGDGYPVFRHEIALNPGNSVNLVYRFGLPQMEYGPTPTSFIPTYGTAVTRPADNPAPNAQSTVSNSPATATLAQAEAPATLTAASAVGVRATLASAQSASLLAAASAVMPAALTASASPAALASSASVAVQGSLSRSAASSVAATASNPVSGSVSQAASPAALAAAASAAQVVLGLSAPASPAILSAAASTTVLGTVSAASAAALAASAAVVVSAALSQGPAPASLSATSNAAQVAGSLSVVLSPVVLSAAALAQQPSAALARTVSSSSSAAATATQPSAVLSKAEAPATLSAVVLAQQPSAALSCAVSATLSASAGVAVAGSLSSPVAATLSAASAVDVAGVFAASSAGAAPSAAAFAVQPSGTVALSLSSVPDSLAADVQVSGYVYQVVFDAVSAFADDPVVGGLDAALDDAGLSSVATAHQPRAALSLTQASTLAAYAELVTLGRVSLTTHNAGISAECVALYEDARDGVVLPSTALDFLPSGIAAKPLYAFLGPLIDRAMTPDAGVNEVAVDPLVGPLLLDFQEAEAVNAYLNMLVHPVVGTRRSLDYALQLLDIGPYITEWWQPNVQSRFDREAPAGPSDKAFHFTVTFPDGGLPKKSFDYRALIRMLFALKNERSRLVSVRMADCVDILTLDNDCDLDKYWLDSLEGFVDEETGVVICLHEDFTQRIDASEHVPGALMTTWRTDTTHAFCQSLLDFTILDDDTTMDGGSFGAATARASQRVLRGIVALRNLDFRTGSYTQPQGRTSSTVAGAGGPDTAARARIARTRDAALTVPLNLAPVAYQTISLRLMSQRVAPEAFYAQRAWADRPDDVPRIWAEPGETWLGRQPQAFCHRTSETLPNWFFGTGAGAVARPSAAGVLFYGVIGSGKGTIRGIGAAGTVTVAPAGPANAVLGRPRVVSGAKVGAAATGAARIGRPAASGLGRMRPQAFGLVSVPLPAASGQGTSAPA